MDVTLAGMAISVRGVSENAHSPMVVTLSGMSWNRDVYSGGNGGRGAHADPQLQPTIYGQGGGGGNGGGGGGNAGGSYYESMIGYDTTYERIDAGTPGNGGRGSAGAQGGNGCAFIYY